MNAVKSLSHLRNRTRQHISPLAKLAVGVYGRHPAFGRSPLDLGELVKSLRLDDHVHRRSRLQAHEEVRLVFENQFLLSSASAIRVQIDIFEAAWPHQ